VDPGNFCGISVDVTGLLIAWRAGDDSALSKLTPAVHSELRRIAKRYIRGERPGQTLPPTGLVNEAYLRLIDARRVQWQDRTHFVAFAAELMRRILVDAARARGSRKRGGDFWRTTLGAAMELPNAIQPDLLDLDAALKSLAATYPRKAKVVELRFFGGLSVKEAAEALSVSEETIGLDWRMAKAWLARELSKGRAVAAEAGS
jgi:RNA polymerase sigma factor (TIGR02999 family)